MPTLTLYYDVVCPYAWIGFSQAERFAEHVGVALRLRPILLGGLFRAQGAPQEPMRSMSPNKARLNALDMLRQAALAGVPARWYPRHPQRTVRAMRLVVGAPEEHRPSLSRALYRAYWVDHREISDPAVVDAIAREQGLDPAIADTSEAREALFATTAEAADLGGFGVPIWRLTGAGEADGWWWGADRLPLVAAALGSTWPAPQPLPRAQDPLPITFFHDFSSPFSYLASRQIPTLATQEGTTVSWEPILVGALFNAIGTPNVPLLAMSPAKASYLARDMREQAEHRGIPFRMPSSFPLRTVLPLRVSLLAPAAIDPIYRAAWAEDRDIGQPDVLREVLDGAGLDGQALIEATADPTIKSRLRANTERAAALGACGVPTFMVGGQIFWGQDRLEMVRQAVRGWVGPSLTLPGAGP